MLAYKYGNMWIGVRRDELKYKRTYVYTRTELCKCVYLLLYVMACPDRVSIEGILFTSTQQ